MAKSSWECDGIPHPKNKKQYTWTGPHPEKPVQVSGAICSHCGLPREAKMPGTLNSTGSSGRNKKIVAFAAVIPLILPIGFFLFNREGGIVPRSSRFWCELRPDPNGRNPNNPEGKEVWTVMYQKRKEAIPWLLIVRPFGGGFDPATRCGEIASRLEQLRQDGLLGLKYREDPNTPKQYVICAVTKQSGDNCPLLITLDEEDDPEENLNQIASSLIEARPGDYQGRGGTWRSPQGQDIRFSIDLRPFLSEEDKRAGE